MYNVQQQKLFSLQQDLFILPYNPRLVIHDNSHTTGGYRHASVKKNKGKTVYSTYISKTDYSHVCKQAIKIYKIYQKYIILWHSTIAMYVKYGNSNWMSNLLLQLGTLNYKYLRCFTTINGWWSGWTGAYFNVF